MISASLAILALAACSAVNGQDNAVQIEAIEAHFAGSGIVPSLLATFEPSALLTINYNGVGDLTPGQALTKEQVGPVPTLTVTPANSSVKLDGSFTVAMVDADIVGTDESKGVTRHWLVNGVSIENNKITNSSATAVANYAGPWPKEGSGSHRYVVLVYAQPSSFTAPKDSNPPTTVVNNFDLNGYVKSSGLGSVVAANYIQVSEGQSTVTVQSTSAVVSSTLAAQQSSGSNPSASKPTGDASDSKTTNGAFSVSSTAFSAILAVVIAVVGLASTL